MSMAISVSVIGCVLVVAISALAAAPNADDMPLWKFPQLPIDRRFVALDDLDHPAKFTPTFQTRTEWEERAKHLRTQILVAAGLCPMPARPPIEPVIWGRIERDGYTIEKVYFTSRTGHYVSGNLYRPTGKAGRLPAILTPHGHWENGRLMERNPEQVQKELDSGAEQTREGATYPLQARCAGLARMGCVVFIYDMVGMGDSAPVPHAEGFRDAQAELRLQSSFGLQTWNSIRALDFLCSLPDVDPKRIAVTGESGGGTQTIFLSAIDDRVAVSVPVVMVSGNMQGGCICENASLLRIDTNNIELTATFAPRPLCAIGADDWTSDIETVGYPELQRIYGLYSATSNVLARHFPFPHNINQISREFTYAWLNRHLKLGLSEPIHEQPFVPARPAELCVFNADHPRPKDAMSTSDLRADLSRESDAQIKELRADPEKYRAVVRAALKVMLHEETPAAAIVVPGSERTLRGDDFVVVHQRVLSRPGEDTAVPVLELSRADMQSDTVLIWSDPKGMASLFEPDGRSLTATTKLLLQHYTILAPDVLDIGQSRPPTATTQPTVKGERSYAGYRFGYNRTLLANRTHDLLTVIAYANSRSPRSVSLLGAGPAGVWTLLAHALTNDDNQFAAIDLGGFDFDQVTTTEDPMLLPGALKYGGIKAISMLCPAARTSLIVGSARSSAMNNLLDALMKREH